MVPAPFEWTREREQTARAHYRAKLVREEKHEKQRLQKLETDSDSARAKKKALIASILDQVNLKF